MAKQKSISFVNTVLVGVVWTAVYFGAGTWFILSEFKFDVLSPAAWGRLFTDFKSGEWAVNSLDTLAFFTAIIFFYPVWAWGWYKLRVVNMTALFKRKEKATAADPLTTKKFAPYKMRMQSGAVYSVDPNTSPATQTPATSKPEVNPAEAQIKAISHYAKGFELESFTHVTLKGQTLDLSLATDERALLITILARPNVNWFFDLEQDPREAAWFCESGRIASPIKLLEDVRDALKEVNPDPLLIPVVVLTGGTLMDMAEAKDVCAKRGILIAGFDNPDTPDLPTLQSIIQENFKKKG